MDIKEAVTNHLKDLRAQASDVIDTYMSEWKKNNNEQMAHKKAGRECSIGKYYPYVHIIMTLITDSPAMSG